MKIRTLVVAALASLAISTTAFAGQWIGSNETSWQFIRSDGTQAVNTWLKIDGLWYYFDGSGTMLHDQWVEGKYYLGSSGAMLTNTTTPDGYKVGADGAWIDESKSSGNATFDRLGELFVEKFNGSLGDNMAHVNPHVENGNTLVVTVSITGSQIDRDMADVVTFAVQKNLDDVYSDFANSASITCGMPVYIRVNYAYNGVTYITKTY